MANILGYMFFSSLEYLAFILLVFSVFTFRPERYMLIITLLTILTTILSYFMTITDLYKIIPIPIIVAPILAFVLNRIFHDKYTYCLVATIGGLVIYGLIQGIVIKLANSVNLPIDINDPYGLTTYFIQSICAVIGISVSVYTCFTHSGFGFSFYRLSNRRFVLLSVCMLLICSIAYVTSVNVHSSTTFMTAICAMIIGTLIIMFLSYQQDQIEFS